MKSKSSVQKYSQLSIDSIDRKLIYELEENCRRSLNVIAKKARVSKQTAHYRLERLVREGIITSFMAIINPSKLGLTNHEVYIQLENISEQKRQGFLEDLIKHPNTRWVASCAGKADLGIAITAENTSKFNAIWQELLRGHPGCVHNYFVSISVGGYFAYPRAYLIGEDSGRVASFLGGEPKRVPLDASEIRLLKILSKDARVPTIELARLLEITENTVRSKLKRLEKDRIIQAYSAITQPGKFGMIHFELLATAESLTPQMEKELETYCLLNPYVTYYLRFIGRYDIDIAFEALTQEHLQKLIIEFRSKFGSLIKDSDIFYILHTHKFDYCAGFV